jgi:hypothetical protein
LPSIDLAKNWFSDSRCLAEAVAIFITPLVIKARFCDSWWNDRRDGELWWGIGA